MEAAHPAQVCASEWPGCAHVHERGGHTGSLARDDPTNWRRLESQRTRSVCVRVSVCVWGGGGVNQQSDQSVSQQQLNDESHPT